MRDLKTVFAILAALLVFPLGADAATECYPPTGTCTERWTDANGDVHMNGIAADGSVIWTAVFEADGDSYGDNPLAGGRWTVDGKTGVFTSPKGQYCTRFACTWGAD